MINKIKDQVSRQGLARNTNWEVKVYPPAGLTSLSKSLSNFISTGGNRLNVNLPGLDLIDSGIQALNNVNVNLPGVNIGTNFSIPTLGYVLSNQGSKDEALSLFCIGATIPGRDLNNVEFRNYGEIRSLGLRHTHTGVNFRYYCSEDLREREFFDQWQNLIFNSRTKQHAYYNDYVARVEIIKYDASWKKQTAIYRLNEAYPTNIAPLELANTGQAVLELDITMNFRNYERIL